MGTDSPGSARTTWAGAGVLFAACMMVVVGIFQMVAGLVAIIDDTFYVVAPNYTFEFDTTTWGWIHLVLGALVLLSGIGLFAAKTWAWVVALILAALSAIANFFFLPYYPFWSIVMIALAVWVIWSLTREEGLPDA